MSALLVSAVDHLEIGVVVATDADRIVYRNLAAVGLQRHALIGVLVDDHLASIITEAQAGRRVARTVELHGSTEDLAGDQRRPDSRAVASSPRSRT